MIPFSREILQRLRTGVHVEAEIFDTTSVFFSSMTGYEEMAMASLSKFIGFLDHIYSAFDAALHAFEVYKVETIGSSYMVRHVSLTEVMVTRGV